MQIEVGTQISSILTLSPVPGSTQSPPLLLCLWLDTPLQFSQDETEIQG